jgi:hypothetical protein
MFGVFHPPHQLQKFDLARRRQRGFRFVEDVDALALAALLEERKKPSPCEWERKSGGGPLSGSSDASSRYRAIEKKLSARKKQPLVTLRHPAGA